MADSYDPNQMYDANGQPLSPDMQYADPNTQYIDPNAQYIDPNAQYADPNAQYIDPNAQYIDPNAQYVDPNQMYSPAQPFVDPNAQYIDPNQTYAPAQPLPPTTVAPVLPSITPQTTNAQNQTKNPASSPQKNLGTVHKGKNRVLSTFLAIFFLLLGIGAVAFGVYLALDDVPLMLGSACWSDGKYIGPNTDINVLLKELLFNLGAAVASIILLGLCFNYRRNAVFTIINILIFSIAIVLLVVAVSFFVLMLFAVKNGAV